jgi:alpha-beta hydrolase superfamily lysophospholipase
MRRDRQIHTVRLASGVRLAYSRHGDPSSVPVLLLHAWDESLGCFDRLFPLLPATMHVLAMDQRGHGDSDKLAGGYALMDVAADVEAFMDAMDLKSAVLLAPPVAGMWRNRSRTAYMQNLRGAKRGIIANTARPTQVATD